MRQAYRFNTSLPAFLAFPLECPQVLGCLREEDLVVLECPQATVAPGAEDAPDLPRGMVVVDMGCLPAPKGDWLPADAAPPLLLLPERHKLGIVKPVQVLPDMGVVLLLEALLAAGPPAARLAAAVVKGVQREPRLAAGAIFAMVIIELLSQFIFSCLYNAFGTPSNSYLYCLGCFFYFQIYWAPATYGSYYTRWYLH